MAGTTPNANATKLAGVMGSNAEGNEVITLPDTGMADHIANPSDAATTQAAVISILAILENCGLIKNA